MAITPTIPARLARTVTSHAEARTRVIRAYRAWYRSAPEICALYALNVSPSAVRLKIRQDFERNRKIDDLNIINVLLHKNQQEYQETMNCWKQEVVDGTSALVTRTTTPSVLLLELPAPHDVLLDKQAARSSDVIPESARCCSFLPFRHSYICEAQADTQPHLMHWFRKYEEPAKPVAFLDKFYAGRDDPKQVNSF
ncbi:hypothetical protein A1Q1_04220 [Trichosporon asahii var. asahii CBS 2479]|uniref:NADH dehydrogenase (Ubiquinone) 1 alpha subcomplex 6 n=1 Tax=Trichosporon asahii var. asahii (strain ATCC 90039 / CBS 2479 / JCM 2466 / KCTC 7840 / NBRC 103889/ NCYC 2677 / UAMH 7654) TaxID=1186058 RepID=J6EW09_TRIAS|nr:hypothetical protein A1Q1_04220 [Trichosporon asahii var. asahii CBS 2479]EJT46977.1 hypothetical protein A1Q1_04220 [Trichosporon asahii var. asahii CBS 2479]